MSFCCMGRRLGGLRAVLAALGVAAMAAVLHVSPAGAAAVTPTVHTGNVNACSDIVPGARGVEIQNPAAGSGTFSDGALSGTYTVGADRTTFSWTSTTVPVSFVVMKGGNDANVYSYGSGVMSDTGLVSPLNDGGNVPAISHVILCYVVQPPVNNPPVNNPPVNNPPVNNPPVNNPPVNNPPVNNPPVNNPQPAAGQGVAVTPPAVVTTAPGTPAPTQDVRGTQAISVSARMRVPTCSTRGARVTVTGSPMRRIVFSVNGRRVRTVNVRAGRRSVTVSLPVGAVRARVTFRNGARARTLRATPRRCNAGAVRPQFTG
jgi:hypothetical protein